MSVHKVKKNKENKLNKDNELISSNNNQLPQIPSHKLVPIDEIEGSDIEDKTKNITSPINIASIVPIPVPVTPPVRRIQRERVNPDPINARIIYNRMTISAILNGRNRWHRAALIGIKRIYPNANINTTLLKTTLDLNINIFVNLARSKGETPQNTLSRVLQELRNKKLVIFIDNLGTYKLARDVIDAWDIIDIR